VLISFVEYDEIAARGELLELVLNQMARLARYIRRALKKKREEAAEIADINGKDARFRDLMRTHQTLVFNLCLRLVKDYFAAEDLAQETFLAAWRTLDQFDGANPAGWLATIAAHKSLDYLRGAAQKRTRAAPDEELLEFPAPAARQPEAEFFDGHFSGVLRAGCEQLREPYRTAALGYYCENKTMAELARETGAPLETVRTRCRRAKGMLRNILEQEVRA
jgi:RNA polymerase sigma-70 factor (ECF subfamily)